MDLSTLPDLAQHFAIAINFMPHEIQEVFHQIENFAGAFGPDSSMGAVEKIYHAGKLVTVGGLFALSISTGNIEGAIATGITEADEVYSLCKEGAAAQAAHAAHETPAADHPAPHA